MRLALLLVLLVPVPVRSDVSTHSVAVLGLVPRAQPHRTIGRVTVNAPHLWGRATHVFGPTGSEHVVTLPGSAP